MAGLQPPGEHADMVNFAADFAPPHVLDAIRAAEPLGEVAHFRIPSNRWRRYDKMRRVPDGLLVFGDAICSFNPIYGQGMTVAALESTALRDCLRAGDHALPAQFVQASAKIVRVAWQTAVCSDLALPEVEGARPPSVRVTNAYLQRVLTAAEDDLVVAQRFIRVIGMVDSPASLMHPAIVTRVAATPLRRRRASTRTQRKPSERCHDVVAPRRRRDRPSSEEQICSNRRCVYGTGEQLRFMSARPAHRPRRPVSGSDLVQHTSRRILANSRPAVTCPRTTLCDAQQTMGFSIANTQGMLVGTESPANVGPGNEGDRW
jgi:hypothetical protein